MNDQLYWYWFCSLFNVSIRRQHKLMDMFHHPKELFYLKESVLGEFLTPKEISKFQRYHNIDYIKKRYHKIKESQSDFILPTDGDYPKRLKEIYDYPYGIYRKGKTWVEMPLTIAIVGSRNPTFYSKEITRKLTSQLSKQGVRIVSGLAKGIDGIAHWSSLDANGTTVGVLGCGIDQVYPRENFQLFEQMIETQTIYSEYEPGVKPMAFRFPERNRIISGLSDGILVIEARQGSGSLITATCGLEHNRDIFTVPGPIDQENYRGSNGLIKQGAKLVESVDDILDEFPKFTKFSENNRVFSVKILAEKEKKVYHSLDLCPKHLNEISKANGLSLQETIESLFHLEQKGYIKQVHHNHYIQNINKR